MIHSNRRRHIDLSSNPDVIEETDDNTQAPIVAAFVDLKGLGESMGRPLGSTFMNRLISLCNEAWRLCQIHPFCDDRSDPDFKTWSRLGHSPHIVGRNGSVDVSMAVEIMHSIATLNPLIIVLAVADSNMLDVVRYAVSRGKIIAAISPYRANVRALQDWCHFTFNLEDLLRRIDENIDLETYDFGEFIRLVHRLEQQLDFVGAQHFIEKKMHQLGVEDMKTRQDIFHLAKEKGIIILGTKDNIKARPNSVTTCFLNMDNDLVIETLNGEEEVLEYTSSSAY